MDGEMLSLFARPEDRRRNPRYACRGRAQIICLPWEGALLFGMLKNLGLGGCCVESPISLELGTQAEMLLRLDRMALRVRAEVRAIAKDSGLCVEFLRMGVGARHMLAELIGDFERARAPRGASRFADHSRIAEAGFRAATTIAGTEIPIIGETASSESRTVIIDPSLDILA
jgi:hypothetical protein